jgi:hypothetical protein
MADPITHCLPLAQPWAWAIIAGKLQVANVDLPPPNTHVGTRIAIEAQGRDLFSPWLMRTLLAIELDHDACEREGVIGSAELEGWVRVEEGKIVETYRPGSVTPFRKLKGLHGRFGWVLRKPKAMAGSGELRAFRAKIEETPAYQRELLSYAKAHGTDGFSPGHLKVLDGLGFRAVKGNGDG